jgi:hypothetical protein
MDRFDLNWPKTDATFYTDGWRCRIVWRQKSGIGGTIDNNAQCIRRLALSLDAAPYLLGALKARGHDRLAAEIESAAELEAVTAPSPSDPSAPDATAAGEANKAPGKAPQPALSAPKGPAPVHPGGGASLDRWLDALDGSGEFEAAANRRSKVWIELGRLGDETLQLKTPAAKGKQEWVVKRTWPDGDRKAEYLAAAAFKGVAAYLIGRGDASAPFMEAALAALQACNHPELSTAANRWRDVMEGETH